MSALYKNIEQLCSKRPVAIGEIAKTLARASLTADNMDFDHVVKFAKDTEYEDYLASPAMAALPAWGKKGVDALLELAFNNYYKNRTNTRALEVLLAISRGIKPTSTNVRYLVKEWDSEKKYKLDEDISKISLYGLREKLLLAFTNEWDRGRILFIIGLMGQFSGIEGGYAKEDLDYFISLIVDNHILINPALLDKFEALLEDAPDREEELQIFLTENPILLDPFTTVLYTKQELGSDFITDYVIRRSDNQYVMVEIENSTDNLFNKKGAFSWQLTDAVSQVRDFQAWVSDNLNYAQKKMPGIKHPEGLVVIGRRRELDDMQLKRLAEENYSKRGHTKIVTYDDLLELARNVYRNFIERPLILKTKDTRSI